METDLARISSDYFVVGIEFDGIHTTCVKAAPIVKYMRGKTLKWIMGYCNEKGWKFEYKTKGGWVQWA
jgi:hypothetical protein